MWRDLALKQKNLLEENQIYWMSKYYMYPLLSHSQTNLWKKLFKLTKQWKEVNSFELIYMIRTSQRCVQSCDQIQILFITAWYDL